MSEETKKKKVEFARVVMESTIKVLSGCDVEENITPGKMEEVRQFSEQLVEQAINMGKKIDKKNPKPMYSSRMWAIALALWSRSKTGYNYLQESGLLILPDQRSLYRLKKKHRSFEGVNYLQYSHFLTK